MISRRRQPFLSIRTEGGLLPSELLTRISRFDASLPSFDADAYGLAKGERLADAIQRAWTRLRGLWPTFQKALERTNEAEPATALTRDRWLLPFFDALGFGRLAAAPAVTIDDKSFPVSHAWGAVPIHLVGARVGLDRRTAGVAGAAKSTPHGVVQELLNRSEERLFGIITNGLQLRLLRDSAALTRLAFVEFDLAAIFDGDGFADFTVLYLLLHVSRFEAPRPEECPLEKWVQTAKEQGTRALDRLRDGVAAAIEALGAGFLSHPANTQLRERLRSGKTSGQDYYRQVLREIYRLLFLFVAEDRDLLLDPAAPPAARERYQRWYSTARLRRLAGRRGGSPHADLYEQFRLVTSKLGIDTGCPELALPALGSFLWSESAVPDLVGARLTNRAFLDALRALTTIEDGRMRRTVDYRNLGTEEFGSVYESLLELHPEINAEALTFSLRTAAGNERKTTGSYYTPDSLIQCLLDSALDPVLDEAAKKPDPEAAILALKVCDPACGSGHFLIAAAHRIAKRLAAARTGDDEPPPSAVRRALRDVIGHCIYGVDLNEMAVELCRVSLWMEALEPGRPLSFLESRIVCGNSLLGATPALIAAGIPDDAFAPLTGDDKDLVRGIKKQNKLQRLGGDSDLFAGQVAEVALPYAQLSATATLVSGLPDASIANVREKEARWRSLHDSHEYERTQRVADAWCSAFVWPKRQDAAAPPTHEVFENLRHGRPVAGDILATTWAIARDYQFFHWHLAFPDVFTVPPKGTPVDNPSMGWSGGFDIVLGNPPWERVKLQEQEWFAARSPEIATAPNAAARKKAIAALRSSNPTLFAAFESDLRRSEGESHLIRNSGRFPLCGRGDVNTYAVFAETNRALLSPRGRLGCIVPSGIATDDTTKHFFQAVALSGRLASLFGFKEIRDHFVDTDSRDSFCLLTVASAQTASRAVVAWGLKATVDLRSSGATFELTPSEFELLNPNTKTCPVFRTRRDAEITKAIYRRVPVLVREGPPEENPWGIKFARMFDMSNDSGLFRTRRQLEHDGFRLSGNTFARGDERWLPLYEAKMLHHFNHRYGDYADHPEGSENTSLPDVPASRLANPSYAVQPRYWVPEREVRDRLSPVWPYAWSLVFRDIARNTDERTVIASVIPFGGVGHTSPLLLTGVERRALSAATLSATLNSLAFDYIARQSMGGTHLTYTVLRQLAAPIPAALETRMSTGHYDSTPNHSIVPHDTAGFILARVVELTFTSHDLTPFARDCGYDGPPFVWNEERRFQLRCELDALFFRLYGISRDDTAYILDTFPIVRRNDEVRFGEYRTKIRVLEILDSDIHPVQKVTPLGER